MIQASFIYHACLCIIRGTNNEDWNDQLLPHRDTTNNLDRRVIVGKRALCITFIQKECTRTARLTILSFFPSTRGYTRKKRRKKVEREKKKEEKEEGGRACRPLPGKRKKMVGGKGEGSVWSVWRGLERSARRERRKGKEKRGKDIGRRSIPRASIQLRSCPVVSPWSTYICIYKYMYIRNLHDTPSTIVHSRASLVITTFDYTM